MEIASGIVSLASLVLGFVIGVRLVARSGGQWGAPELWLGVFFVGYHALGATLSAAVYTGWARPEFALSDHVAARVNGAYYAASVLGSSGLVVFTWLTFRPRLGWAKGLATLLVGGMLAGFAMLAWTEGLQVRVWHGPGYWLVLAARSAAFVWLGIESLHAWRMSLRRLQLGLSDPLTSNRFVLIACWSVVTMLLSWSDPLSRFWYVSLVGSKTEWVPELGAPIIARVVVFATSLLCVSGALLMLSFFPTVRYRGWVQARAARHRA